ncbi:hypothetical protein ABEB36_015598 [Hypothenemus hampei]|uniref:Uncharacterized protein n=1 Tax=Hypothenemus hampei TaxID=57062 RepID=A0ABD1DZE2_HYPHA
MAYNNMLGKPNESNQQSVFRFEAYPGPQNFNPWTEPKQIDSQTAQYQNTGYNYGQNFSPLPMLSQIPSSFSFSNTSTLSGTNISSMGQFPYQVINPGCSQETVKLLLGKRKCDSPPLVPCKQHITEEKMAEHMSRLHISSDMETSPLEPESVKNKRLYMCDEMRKLQADTLLPASLMAKFQKPCTALVLWQPQPRLSVFANTFNNNNNSESDATEEDDVSKNKDTSKNEQLDIDQMECEGIGTMDLDL